MRTITKRMSRWRALFAIRSPFAIVAAILTAVGAFAVEPAWATREYRTHTGKTACIRVEGYESKWTKHDNSADISLWNSATATSNYEKLIYKSIGNWASNRDKWHCHSLNTYTTKPTWTHNPSLNNTGTIYVNNSADDPVYFNLHEAKDRICMTMRRNNKGNKWTDANNSDVWDIEQRNTDGNC